MLLIDVLVLQRLKGFGNRTLVKLINFYRANQFNTLRELTSVNLTKVSVLNRTTAERLSNLFSNDEYDVLKRDCEEAFNKWKIQGIDVLVYGSARYPVQLMSLNEPPALLFCKGNCDLLKTSKSIAVVGTRHNTKLGEKITRKTVEYFSKKGFCIVSGLALGIDAVAHRAALDNKGSTIAVLVDLLNIAPASHRDLADTILRQGGLLVSENPPGTNVIPGLFAKRDRIQAGLALAVFAIETATDGGTMHAVKAANSMRRNVYVPNVHAAGYPDLGIKQISGIQDLVKSGDATSYTRDTYIEITQSLARLTASLEDASWETGGLP